MSGMNGREVGEFWVLWAKAGRFWTYQKEDVLSSSNLDTGQRSEEALEAEAIKPDLATRDVRGETPGQGG